MVDGLSFHAVTGPTLKELAHIRAEANRATKKTLRAVGARVRAEAKRRAPIYDGPGRTVSYGDGNSGPLIPGELKKSIATSKRYKINGPSDYSLFVGPRGGHVHLYAAKQEALTPYMKPAFEIASREARATYTWAWEKAMHS